MSLEASKVLLKVGLVSHWPLFVHFRVLGERPLENYFLKTRFQLILPVPNHNVTKDLMGNRMHVEGPQTYQMNRQINSFQNVCDMLYAKIDRLARKIDSPSCLSFCVFVFVFLRVFVIIFVFSILTMTSMTFSQDCHKTWHSLWLLQNAPIHH